jgi:hypothetical protein
MTVIAIESNAHASMFNTAAITSQPGGHQFHPALVSQYVEIVSSRLRIVLKTRLPSQNFRENWRISNYFELLDLETSEKGKQSTADCLELAFERRRRLIEQG